MRKNESLIAMYQQITTASAAVILKLLKIAQDGHQSSR